MSIQKLVVTFFPGSVLIQTGTLIIYLVCHEMDMICSYTLKLLHSYTVKIDGLF